ncbi:SDR family NAD(P)-dependent oxidoreductase [Amycolatopsis pigmentata]|uniref:SDR family NAD(P)-dependent oxidoreductase n=1 Tax=Amycolatopsis pigmentata TaxID=450801 RepID=A0ABW5FXM3_9PSEU
MTLPPRDEVAARVALTDSVARDGVALTDPVATDGVALITGAASGIGAAVARRCAARGMRVVIADRNERGGRSVADETGGRFVAVDVGVPEANNRAVSMVMRELGRLDVAVLNAGIPGRCTLTDFTPDRYRQTMRTNLDGVVYGVHAVMAPMRRQGGGSIVVMASMAGLTGSPDLFYATAKHAVLGLVRSAATPLASAGIRINALCPGFVDTPILAPVRQDLLGRGFPLAHPDEAATAVEEILAAGKTGQAWLLQAGEPAYPIEPPEIPLRT